MKFFLDTANLDELKRTSESGIIDGVTTNPSVIAKEGVPIAEQIRRICDIVDGDISAETMAVDSASIVREWRELAKIHKNLLIKVPLTRDDIKACSTLSKDGCKVHVGTAPFKVYESLFNHPLTDQGLDQFLKDNREACEEVTVAV